MISKNCLKILVSALIFMSANYCQAANINDVGSLKPLMPRVGVDNKIEEKQEIQNVTPDGKVAAPKAKAKNQAKAAVPKKVRPATYADMSVKELSQEMSEELSMEQNDVLGDLRILWQAAATKSETIRFAVYKLSNPEGKSEDKSLVKKMLTPIAGIAPLVGMTAASPFALGSSIMSSGLLNSYLDDGSALNEKLSRVSDADMIILIKEIDDLQKNLLNDYYKYVSAMKANEMAEAMVQKRYNYYLKTQNLDNEQVAIADAFYHESLDIRNKTRQDYMSSRSALEQLVGNDTLMQVEDSIHKRLASK